MQYAFFVFFVGGGGGGGAPLNERTNEKERDKSVPPITYDVLMQIYFNGPIHFG